MAAELRAARRQKVEPVVCDITALCVSTATSSKEGLRPRRVSAHRVPDPVHWRQLVYAVLPDPAGPER